MNIYLIGYRCTGKTSVGKTLAEMTDMLFFDTDLDLVKEEGMDISEIIELSGWDVFRNMEKTIIKKVCSKTGFVVATGGGAVLDKENVDLMKSSGTLIWLRASTETIKKRMFKDPATKDFRPPLTSKGSIDEIEETVTSRNPYYKEAMDFYVDTDSKSISEICDSIIKELNRE